MMSGYTVAAIMASFVIFTLNKTSAGFKPEEECDDNALMQTKHHKWLDNKETNAAEGPAPLPWTSAITVSSGDYAEEVGWTLTCTDGTSLSGGAPFEGSAAVTSGSECLLYMTDSYGDGWN